jgi:hypothetical protein
VEPGLLDEWEETDGESVEEERDGAECDVDQEGLPVCLGQVGVPERHQAGTELWRRVPLTPSRRCRRRRPTPPSARSSL